MGFLSKKKEKNRDTTYCEVLRCNTRYDLEESLSKRIREGRVIKDLKLTNQEQSLVLLILYDHEAESKK
ncbi:hypothetical protein [uncultured Fusobacterium sp.]|uniref:hypothetical protein n=1 Tax=uncultured Fusobacterium sp. TaxID=159267 RepID=UPI002590582F|nr:hypothetical protein [uncultured Fusobacterium sp.]